MVISSDFNYWTTLWKYGKHPREVMEELITYSRVAVADLDSAAVYSGSRRTRAPSGDAFTGGMLYGLMRGSDPQQIIDFATACGALKQSIVGDWAVVNRSEVEQYMQNGSPGRILR